MIDVEVAQGNGGMAGKSQERDHSFQLSKL